MSLTGDKRSNLMLIAMIVILVVATLFSMFLYQNAAVARIRSRAYATLGAGVEEEKGAFVEGLDWQYLSLETVAVGVARTDVETIDSMLADIRSLAEETDYLKVYLADLDGVSQTENGLINVSDRIYFQRSLNGQRGLDVVQSRIDGETRFIISVPVVVDGQVACVLYATCREESFKTLLEADSAAESNAFICGTDGKIIVGASPRTGSDAQGNLFAGLADGMPRSALSALREDFAAGRSGIATYGPSGSETYIAYVPLGVNGWIMCSSASSMSVNEEVVQTVKSGYLIITAIMIISAAFVLIFAYMIKQSSQRILHDQALLNESDARYRMAIENTAVVLWDYDINKRRITMDERSMRLIGAQKPIIDNAVEFLISAGYIHADSAKDMRELHDKLARGAKNTEGVIMLRSRFNEAWRYEHVRYTNLFDEKGAPYLAIGMGEDVTSEYIDKRRMDELSAAVKSDSMTGLLNHGATFDYIKRYLRTEGVPGTHALFMIDIDDFKNVNDTFGHQIGDETIQKIALAIKNTFRASDIIGRVGGDEFMVLMKNVPDMGYVKKKARELIEALRIPCDDGSATGVSASVGIAVCRGMDCVFEQIYAEADGALYRAKNAGKNRYAIDGEYGKA
jgi:diguanylate cyclase (GGDEF)-like protein